MDLSDDNLFDHIDMLQRSLVGRTVLGYRPSNTANQEDLADVFIVKFILDGLEDSEQDSETSQSSWFGRIWRYIRGGMAMNSRTTHWAVEIRGDLYETFRDKNYALPWKWRATLKMTAEEILKNEPQRNLVERLRVGTTALSTKEIAERTMRYELYYRPYSIFGDNCQQFIMRFCREIDVKFDEEASKRLKMATDIANLLRLSLSLLCLLFLLDIFGNKGRFTLATSLHSALAFLGMILLTFSHPRMFLLDVSHLPFNISHFIIVLVGSFVWFLWVLVGAVLCFSFERVCDQVAVRIVDGVELFDIWNSCNIFLRIAQLLISVVCLLGGIYHSYYSSYFILE